MGELAFTTDNTHEVAQRVLPTFGVILTQFRTHGRRIDIGSFDPALLVHAEQEVSLTGAIPTRGTMTVASQVAGIFDKGSGALVVTETTGTLPGANEPLVTTRAAMFIRGEGGFGVRGPSAAWQRPDRAADLVIECGTRPDQALLYRLSGDHNPLHTDPWFAGRAGFDRPILHGMCTYGVVARVLLNARADGDVAAFGSMSARFSRPVYPGEALRIHVWDEPDGTSFVTENAAGDVVLDRGTVDLG